MCAGRVGAARGCWGGVGACGGAGGWLGAAGWPWRAVKPAQGSGRGSYQFGAV